VLGHVVIKAKSNEIKPIPALLELLELEGAIVTCDAMGTQKAIAAKIIEKKSRLLLSAQGQSKCVASTGYRARNVAPCLLMHKIIL